jgi:colicin import membrane protein
MPSVTAAHNHAGQYRRGLAISAVVHLLLLLALGSSLILIPKQPIPRKAIEAFVVNENSLQQSTAVKPRPPQPAVVAPVAKPAEEPVKPKEQERKEEERKAAEAKADAEQKVQERKAAEAKAVAEKKAETEKKAQEKKAAEAKAKAEAEKKEEERKAAEAKAEAERKATEAKAEAAKAEAAKQEQARRQAELAAAMAAEEDLFAAQQSGEMDVYITRIKTKVEGKWVPPASAQSGLECEVVVTQLPSGDVVKAETVRCNGDEAVRRSIETAVLAASPLPLPDNPSLFERNLRFLFKPEQ